MPPRVDDVLDVTPPQALSNARFADYGEPSPSVVEESKRSGDRDDCRQPESGWRFGERLDRDREKPIDQQEKHNSPGGPGGLKGAIQRREETKLDVNITGHECGSQFSSMVDDDGQQGFSTCGTTSLVVVVTEQHVICCNTGDSRAVLASEGASRPLSRDHKPDNRSERARY